jgi:ribosomal protein S19E (S16A)
VSFLTKLKCLLGMHQGKWKTIDEFGCQRSRFCISCGETQYQERHKWSGPHYPRETIPFIWYDICRNCGKTMGKTGEVNITHTRAIQEMSQDQSLMFSDAVYLFGNTFASAPSWRDSEELPDGTKVSQKTLAEQVVLAAFAYLYQKQLIAIALGERKPFFRKYKTAIVKPLQSTAPDLSGVEAVIFSSIQYNDYINGITGITGFSHMYGLTLALIQRTDDFTNPWHEVLKIVKKNLLQRGILKRVEKGKILFITTHKYVVNGDISKDISQAAKHITELKKTLEELQSKGELYQQILSDIEKGIASQANTDTGD